MRTDFFENINFDIVYETVDALTMEALDKDIVCYDVSFEEIVNGENVPSSGKAFSIDGLNFFGFTHNDAETSLKTKRADYSKDRVFAGSYIQDKGLSIVVMPLDKLHMQSNMQDFEFNGVYKAESQNVYGEFMGKPVKIVLNQNKDQNSEQILIDYFDMLAIITKNHPNKALLIVEKILSQDSNVEIINRTVEEDKSKSISEIFESEEPSSNEQSK